jgi:hypothetical protein
MPRTLGAMPLRNSLGSGCITMKKLFPLNHKGFPYLVGLIVLSFLAFIFFNMSDASPKRVGLSPIDPEGNEKQVFQAVGINEYFIYRINLPNLKKGLVHYWVDQYKEGTKKELLEGKTPLKTVRNDVGELMLAIRNVDENQRQWILSYSDSGGSNSATIKMPITKDTSFSYQRSGTVANSVGRPSILGVIIDGKSNATIPDKIFTYYDEPAVNEPLNNKAIYVLRFEVAELTDH